MKQREPAKPVERRDAPPFEYLDSYEELLRLRSSDPKAFRLRTSGAALAALDYYEKARRAAESKGRPLGRFLSVNGA